MKAPWCIRPGLANTLRDADGALLAEFPSHWTTDEPRALAMRAVPEMLAALKLAGPALETLMCEVTGKHAANWGKVNDAAVAISAAIHKSEGGAV